MKNKVILFYSIIFISLFFNHLSAAGIYENANQSAEFVRTLTRYASTDIDSAFFNPAGSAFMKDGMYGYFSDQMLFDYQTMTDSSTSLSSHSFPDKYEGEAMTWAFPDLYAMYKQGEYSAFIHMGLIGRGAAATYENCIPMVNTAITLLQDFAGYSQQKDYRLEAYAYFIGMTLGGAYKINDIFSVSGSVRYVHAEQNIILKFNFTNPTPTEPNIDVNVDADGNSCGFIGGFDIKPVDDLNIGFKCEYYTVMNLTNQKPNSFEGPLILITNPQFKLTEGAKTKMTLPINTSLGISYMVTPELKVEGGYIYYFNKLADWGKDVNGKDLAKKYDNGYDASIAVEYALMQQLKGSVGYSHSVSGVNSATRNNEQFGLDANSFAVGGTYTFANGVEFTLATMAILFKDTTESNPPFTFGTIVIPDSGTTKYQDRTYSIAASVTYIFM